MTFQQLTYVVEISKCGSINKAAHKLFLSQSGISTAVRELEEELGIKFFVRSNRGGGVYAGGQGVSGLCSLAAGTEAADRELYGEASAAARPSGSPSPPSAIPSRRTPFCGCFRALRKTATASPSGRPVWTL